MEVPFRNSIICKFMVYQDHLETNLLQLFAHPENSVCFSIIFVVIFEVDTVAEKRILVTSFLFFICFQCPQFFYCLPFPVAYLGFPAPGGKLSFGAPTQPVHGSIDAKNELMETVAYLGFPAPGDKLSFGAPTQPVHGSIDAKNELMETVAYVGFPVPCACLDC